MIRIASYVDDWTWIWIKENSWYTLDDPMYLTQSQVDDDKFVNSQPGPDDGEFEYLIDAPLFKVRRSKNEQVLQFYVHRSLLGDT